MYCKNCGNKLNGDEKFCSNCGMIVESNSDNSNISNMNSNSNINNTPQQINSASGQANKWKTISMVLGIIAIVLSFVFCIFTLPLSIIGLIFGIKANKEDNKSSIGFILNIVAIVIAIMMTIIVSVIDLPNNENNDYNNNNSYNDSNYGETGGVKGNYSRDAFSGNSFEYKTGYDSATFIFNKDSTFEVSYVNGATYKGTYELYNGLYISVKADEIKNDTSINNNQQLSTDINNVANKMISNANDMLNTYLIWLKTDNNIIQPFVISYNPDSNSGIAVNILGQTQGTFNLK